MRGSGAPGTGASAYAACTIRACEGHWNPANAPFGSALLVAQDMMFVESGEEIAMERDPVCGAELMPGKEEAEAQFKGKTYRFCSRECRDLFVKNPGEYVNAEGPA